MGLTLSNRPTFIEVTMVISDWGTPTQKWNLPQVRVNNLGIDYSPSIHHLKFLQYFGDINHQKMTQCFASILVREMSSNISPTSSNTYRFECFISLMLELYLKITAYISHIM